MLLQTNTVGNVLCIRRIIESMYVHYEDFSLSSYVVSVKTKGLTIAEGEPLSSLFSGCGASGRKKWVEVGMGGSLLQGHSLRGRSEYRMEARFPPTSQFNFCLTSFTFDVVHCLSH